MNNFHFLQIWSVNDNPLGKQECNLLQMKATLQLKIK